MSLLLFSVSLCSSSFSSLPLLSSLLFFLGLNGKVLYSFEDSAEGLFAIQEHSGIISLEKPLVPSVQATTYTIRVRATDLGSPRQLSSLGSATVTVRTASNIPPAFQLREYVATVPEDISMGTQILRVFAGGGGSNSDAGRAEITYSITGGNEQGAFSINSRTGTWRPSVRLLARLRPSLNVASRHVESHTASTP